MKTKRKGFTIVELVIVIAVIAILAAVLIPTFSGIIKKANESTDTQLVRNLNTALVSDNKEHKTMQSALDAAKEFGFDVDKINTKVNENEILWDSVNDCFVYKKGTVIEYIPNSKTTDDVKDYQYWQIANALPAAQTYSIYAGKGWTEPTVGTVDKPLTVGFDAGEAARIESITYDRSTATEKRDVVIRTNSASTTLTINVYDNGSKCDTVNHYDVVGKLVATNAGMGSYHENGKTCFAEVTQGKIVAENQSEITVLHAKTVNVAVVENGGEIKGAYATDNAINTANTNNGGNKELMVVTQEVITAKGKEAQNAGIADEAVENKLETDPSVAAYVSNGADVTFYTSLQDAVTATDNGGTINVVRDQELSEVLTISNKNLRIVGKGNVKPVITGAIEIRNAGGKTVAFDNIKFDNNRADNSNISDISTCTSEDDVNTLLIENCDFVTSIVHKKDNKQISVISICHTNQKVGSQLIFRGNSVKLSGDGYYHNIIATSATLNERAINWEKATYWIKGYKQHIIDGNVIDGNGKADYMYVGGFAEIMNNTISNFASRACQLFGAYPHGGEQGAFDVVIYSNTFKNMDEIFKVYTVDGIIGEEYFNFEIEGSTGAKANTFEEIETLGETGKDASTFNATYATILAEKTYSGVQTPTIAFKLAQVELTLEKELTTDYMTLSDGTQVMTYTQAIKPTGGSRTGYYITVGGKKLWYFATSRPHYFIDDDNNVYLVYLGAGGATTADKLAFTDKAVPTSWDAKYICERGNEQSVIDKENITSDKVIVAGDFYKTDFKIDQKDNNTVYNGTVTKAGNKLTVESSNASSVNLFVSNTNGCNKLLVTANSSAVVDKDTYVIVVPGAIGQLVVNGTYDVTVDVDIANINVLGKQHVTINAEKNVSGILKVTGTDAIGAKVTNNGTIGKLYVHAKTDVTNNGKITTLLVGDSLPGGISAKLKTVIDAHDSTITNNGKIMSIHAITKITLTNDNSGSIDGLTIGFLGEGGMEYAKDSRITNNGNMCNLANGNINLYVKCEFTNNGTIGKEGRETGASSNCGCKNVGGCINIGYWGYRDAHDGLVFNNSGTIYAGARHNGAHQQYTFSIWGVKAGYGTKKPYVFVNNSGTIKGNNWITACDIAAVHNVPPTYENK